VSRSRLVPLALGVTLLLAAVAVAARGRPLGSGGGGRGGLPFGFWEYTYTTIVILVIPLLVTGLFVTTLMRRRQRKRRSYGVNLLISFATFVAVLAFELLIVRHLKNLHLHVPTPQPPQQAGGQPVHSQGQNNSSSSASRTLHFRWGELIVILGLLVVAGAIVAALLLSRDSDKPDETVPEVLAAALDESLDDLRSDPDLRRAIIAAYARMETALAAAGIPRDPAEAPLEYVERALLSLDTSAGAVRKLTDLFEWARFSHHEPEPSMRDDAVDALVAVRDELRASELELTPA
jgi:hypothetical protein